MKAFGITDIGRMRKNNQDYLFISEDAVGNLPNIYIVADGMGGHKAGEVASKGAVESILSTIGNTELTDPVSIIEEAVTAANNRVLEMSRDNPEYEGMGTTLVVTTVFDKDFYVANIGDSRLYVIGEDIHQITRDHSYVEEMVSRGELDKDSARTHAKKNVITRAVGVEAGTYADYFQVKYKKGDKILMCSDGLSNMIKDEELKTIVKKEATVQEIVNELVYTANHNGGSDNITAIVVEL
ncbi:MAG: Stp1/IreP family PP2C-type Ser/Thr phosphatase [Lachnospiraceae bacterium]|nr:Stp1/IreP family PP2C-type Ser/Thr phosphatase [Lachnospiraceae bacterium]